MPGVLERPIEKLRDTGRLESSYGASPASVFPRFERRLPLHPTAEQLAEHIEYLSSQEVDTAAGTLRLLDAVMALPLPAKPAKAVRLSPFRRHVRIAAMLAKTIKQVAWLTQEMRDLGYFRYSLVRDPVQVAAAALRDALDGMERESWRDCGAVMAAEEAAIEAVYAGVKAGLVP